MATISDPTAPAANEAVNTARPELISAIEVAELFGFDWDERTNAKTVHLMRLSDYGPQASRLGSELYWLRSDVEAWLARNDPRMALRYLGEYLFVMSEHVGTVRALLDEVNERASAPVDCPSWCRDGDGHTDAQFREDQRCSTDDLRIELSLHRPIANVIQTDDGDYTSKDAPDWLSVWAEQLPDQTARFGVARSEGPEVQLTAGEVAQLVGALQLLLGQVTPA